jgi:phage baseplate assembly protein W
MTPVPLSDKNVTNQNAEVVSRRRQYSDLDMSMYHYVGPDQTKADIIPFTDIDAVKNAVRILLSSNQYDRPFSPYLGANLKSLLFEPADRITRYSIEQTIKLLLEKHEPRINQITVDVSYDGDEDRYVVLLTFNIISIAVQTDMRLFLTRVR